MSEARNEVEKNWGEHSPSYYRAMAIQPTDYAVANRLPHLQACIVKYATRAGRKPGEPELKDAKKCLAFAKRWVAELEAVAETKSLLADETMMAAFQNGAEQIDSGKTVPWREVRERIGIDLAAVAQSCVAPKAG